MKSLKKWNIINNETGAIVASYMLQATAFDMANAMNLQAVFSGNPAFYVVRYADDDPN